MGNGIDFSYSFSSPDNWTEEELCWVLDKLMNLKDKSDPNSTLVIRENFKNIYFQMYVERVHDDGILRPYNKGYDYVSTSIGIVNLKDDKSHSELDIDIFSRNFQEIRDFIRRGLS